MIICKRTNSENEDFKGLVKELDKELAHIDGKDHTFYSRYNTIDAIKHVIVAYDRDMAVGCGAIKEYASETTPAAEVKRMYVPNSFIQRTATRLSRTMGNILGLKIVFVLGRTYK